MTVYWCPFGEGGLVFLFENYLTWEALNIISMNEAITMQCNKGCSLKGRSRKGIH